MHTRILISCYVTVGTFTWCELKGPNQGGIRHYGGFGVLSTKFEEKLKSF
jgi:hypothetical protein